VRLRRKPFDGAHLVLGEPRPRVALAKHRAVVATRGPDRSAVWVVAAEPLAAEILGASRVGDVLVERHASGEPLRCDDALSHVGLLARPYPHSAASRGIRGGGPAIPAYAVLTNRFDEVDEDRRLPGMVRQQADGVEDLPYSALVARLVEHQHG